MKIMLHSFIFAFCFCAILANTYPDILKTATFSFRNEKFPRPHVSVYQSNLPFNTYPTRIQIHSITQDSSVNIGNRACVVTRARKICILEFASTSKRENGGTRLPRSSIHGKELGWILLSHRIKKISGFNLTSTPFQIHSVIKNFHSGEQI